MFNIMRGGIFDDNYTIEKADFTNYIHKANIEVFKRVESTLKGLEETFTLQTLKAIAAEATDADFKRLSYEYLPLKFSRRHGDPSRPWNKFSINTRNEVDGSKILDYQGNWRDIFQNWEALAHSYPEFMEGMIHKFLNATTLMDTTLTASLKTVLIGKPSNQITPGLISGIGAITKSFTSSSSLSLLKNIIREH